MRAFLVADLFCGAGGSSNGILDACASRGLRTQLTAVNHWAVAVATHERNHPEHRHFCADLDSTSPHALVPEGRLDLLWASPSCTEHSYAKGGRAVDDQKRVTAWCIVRWIEALRPRAVIVENVKQFANWAPLDAKRRPIRSREGETFDAWCNAIRSLGYSLDHAVLNAADYGDPQTRRRLFVIAMRGRRRISWPMPTHARNGRGGLKPWVSARSVIDFDLPSESIFARNRPLAPNTIARIEAGLRRFVQPPFAEAFLVILRRNATGGTSLDEPFPTITARGTHLALVEPFLFANRTNNAPRGVDEPLPTVTTATANVYLAEPFVLGQHGGSVARAVDEPLPTIACDGAISMVEPFVVDVRHGDRPHQPRSVDEPLGTITSKNGVAIVEPFLAAHYGAREGQTPRTHPIGDPLPTVTTANRFGLVEPTVSPRPSGMPVTIGEQMYWLDIRYRMLQLGELAAGQSFPPGYQFAGTKTDAVAQVGNAVPKRLSEALTSAVLDAILPARSNAA
jgi:DNA (cytosine-5)-methyltransferase 1